MGVTAKFFVAPACQRLRWRCAYHFAKKAIEAFSSDRLIEVDVDIPVVAQLVAARMPAIQALRKVVASSLADFDMRAFDKLELQVHAMCYAHWLHASTCISSCRMRAWLDEWPAAHERLVAEARRLQSNRILGRNCFDHCPNRKECRDGLSGGQRLCCLFLLNWSHIESVTDLQQSELAYAEILAELALALQVHGEDPRNMESAFRLNRQRAFSLFLSSYDQVRRAVQFIRWNEGDANDIAPALCRRVVTRCPDSAPPISTRYAIASTNSTAFLVGQKKTERAS